MLTPLEFNIDVKPANFALQLVQRLGSAGLVALEAAIRGHPSGRGVSSRDFVDAAVRCLSYGCTQPEACAFPWQRKVAVSVSGQRTYSVRSDDDPAAEARPADFLPESVSAHGGVNFINMGDRLPFSVDHSRALEVEQQLMAKFITAKRSLDRSGAAARANPSAAAAAMIIGSTINSFDSIEALIYSLRVLYQDMDSGHRNELTWEDVGAYLGDVTTHGAISMGKQIIPKLALTLSRPIAMGKGVQIAKAATCHVSGTTAVALSDRSIGFLDPATFQIKSKVARHRPEFGAVSSMEMFTRTNSRRADAAAAAAAVASGEHGTADSTPEVRGWSSGVCAVSTDDCVVRLYADDTNELLYSRPFGTPQTVMTYLRDQRMLFCGSKSGVISTVRGKHRTLWHAEIFSTQLLPTAPITGFASVSSRSNLLACNEAGYLAAFDLETRAVVGDIMLVPSKLRAIDYSPDYRLIGCGGDGCPHPFLMLQDRCTAPIAMQESDRTHAAPIEQVMFIYGTPQFMSVDASGTIKLWDIRMMAVTQTINTCRNIFKSKVNFPVDDVTKKSRALSMLVSANDVDAIRKTAEPLVKARYCKTTLRVEVCHVGGIDVVTPAIPAASDSSGGPSSSSSKPNSSISAPVHATDRTLRGVDVATLPAAFRLDGYTITEAMVKAKLPQPSAKGASGMPAAAGGSGGGGVHLRRRCSLHAAQFDSVGAALAYRIAVSGAHHALTSLLAAPEQLVVSFSPQCVLVWRLGSGEKLAEVNVAEVYFTWQRKVQRDIAAGRDRRRMLLTMMGFRNFKKLDDAERVLVERTSTPEGMEAELQLAGMAFAPRGFSLMPEGTAAETPAAGAAGASLPADGSGGGFCIKSLSWHFGTPTVTPPPAAASGDLPPPPAAAAHVPMYLWLGLSSGFLIEMPLQLVLTPPSPTAAAASSSMPPGAASLSAALLGLLPALAVGFDAAVEPPRIVLRPERFLASEAMQSLLLAEGAQRPLADIGCIAQAKVVEAEQFTADAFSNPMRGLRSKSEATGKQVFADDDGSLPQHGTAAGEADGDAGSFNAAASTSIDRKVLLHRQSLTLDGVDLASLVHRNSPARRKSESGHAPPNKSTSGHFSAAAASSGVGKSPARQSPSSAASAQHVILPRCDPEFSASASLAEEEGEGGSAPQQQKRGPPTSPPNATTTPAGIPLLKAPGALAIVCGTLPLLVSVHPSPDTAAASSEPAIVRPLLEAERAYCAEVWFADDAANPLVYCFLGLEAHVAKFLTVELSRCTTWERPAGSMPPAQAKAVAGGHVWAGPANVSAAVAPAAAAVSGQPRRRKVTSTEVRVLRSTFICSQPDTAPLLRCSAAFIGLSLPPPSGGGKENNGRPMHQFFPVVIATDAVGSVSLFSHPPTSRHHPVCVSRFTTFHGPGEKFTPPAVSSQTTEHGLLFVAAGRHVGVYNARRMCETIFPADWSLQTHTPSEMVVEAHGPLEVGQGAGDRLVQEERLRNQPPTPTLLAQFELDDDTRTEDEVRRSGVPRASIVQLVYMPLKHCLLVLASDSTLHVFSLWGEKLAVCNVLHKADSRSDALASSSSLVLTDSMRVKEAGNVLRQARNFSCVVDPNTSGGLSFGSSGAFLNDLSAVDDVPFPFSRKTAGGAVGALSVFRPNFHESSESDSSDEYEDERPGAAKGAVPPPQRSGGAAPMTTFKAFSDASPSLAQQDSPPSHHQRRGTTTAGASSAGGRSGKAIGEAASLLAPSPSHRGFRTGHPAEGHHPHRSAASNVVGFDMSVSMAVAFGCGESESNDGGSDGRGSLGHHHASSKRLRRSSSSSSMLEDEEQQLSGGDKAAHTKKKGRPTPQHAVPLTGQSLVDWTLRQKDKANRGGAHSTTTDEDAETTAAAAAAADSDKQAYMDKVLEALLNSDIHGMFAAMNGEEKAANEMMALMERAQERAAAVAAMAEARAELLARHRRRRTLEQQRLQHASDQEEEGRDAITIAIDGDANTTIPRGASSSNATAAQHLSFNDSNDSSSSAASPHRKAVGGSSKGKHKSNGGGNGTAFNSKQVYRDALRAACADELAQAAMQEERHEPCIRDVLVLQDITLDVAAAAAAGKKRGGKGSSSRSSTPRRRQHGQQELLQLAGTLTGYILRTFRHVKSNTLHQTIARFVGTERNFSGEAPMAEPPSPGGSAAAAFGAAASSPPRSTVSHWTPHQDDGAAAGGGGGVQGGDTTPGAPSPLPTWSQHRLSSPFADSSCSHKGPAEDPLGGTRSSGTADPLADSRSLSGRHSSLSPTQRRPSLATFTFGNCVVELPAGNNDAADDGAAADDRRNSGSGSAASSARLSLFGDSIPMVLSTRHHHTVADEMLAGSMGVCTSVSQQQQQRQQRQSVVGFARLQQQRSSSFARRVSVSVEDVRGARERSVSMVAAMGNDDVAQWKQSHIERTRWGSIVADGRGIRARRASCGASLTVPSSDEGLRNRGGHQRGSASDGSGGEDALEATLKGSDGEGVAVPPVVDAAATPAAGPAGGGGGAPTPQQQSEATPIATTPPVLTPSPLILEMARPLSAAPHLFTQRALLSSPLHLAAVEGVHDAMSNKHFTPSLSRRLYHQHKSALHHLTEDRWDAMAARLGFEASVQEMAAVASAKLYGTRAASAQRVKQRDAPTDMRNNVVFSSAVGASSSSKK